MSIVSKESRRDILTLETFLMDCPKGLEGFRTADAASVYQTLLLADRVSKLLEGTDPESGEKRPVSGLIWNLRALNARYTAQDPEGLKNSGLLLRTNHLLFLIWETQREYARSEITPKGPYRRTLDRIGIEYTHGIEPPVLEDIDTLFSDLTTATNGQIERVEQEISSADWPTFTTVNNRYLLFDGQVILDSEGYVVETTDRRDFAITGANIYRRYNVTFGPEALEELRTSQYPPEMYTFADHPSAS